MINTQQVRWWTEFQTTSSPTPYLTHAAETGATHVVVQTCYDIVGYTNAGVNYSVYETDTAGTLLFFSNAHWTKYFRNKFKLVAIDGVYKGVMQSFTVCGQSKDAFCVFKNIGGHTMTASFMVSGYTL